MDYGWVNDGWLDGWAMDGWVVTWLHDRWVGSHMSKWLIRQDDEWLGGCWWLLRWWWVVVVRVEWEVGWVGGRCCGLV